METVPTQLQSTVRFIRRHLGRIGVGLILVAMVYAAMSAVLPYQREKGIAEKIKAIGGKVEWYYRGPNWVPQSILERVHVCERIGKIELSCYSIPSDLLSEILGCHGLRCLFLLVLDQQLTDTELEHLKSLKNLHSLFLGDDQITDAGLVHFNTLTKLEHLGLSNARITNTGLAHLKGMHRLQFLGLNGTQVSDNGLEHLKALVNLRYLDLCWTKVTDAGLDHLTSLTSLEKLDLDRTETTPEGRAILRKALPACQIEPNDLPIPLNLELPTHMQPPRMPGIPLESGIYQKSDLAASSDSSAKKPEPSDLDIELSLPSLPKDD